MLAGPFAAERLRDGTRAHTRVLCLTSSAVCTDFQGAGRMFDRTHRAAPGWILCNQRRAGINSINFFPGSVIPTPFTFGESHSPDIPAPLAPRWTSFYFQWLLQL